MNYYYIWFLGLSIYLSNFLGQTWTATPRLVCYFTNWARYRQGPGAFYPKDIQPELCTDIIYAFQTIDTGALTLNPPDDWADKPMYGEVVALKANNANLKVHLAVGGWHAGSPPFQAICDSISKMETFAENLIAYLREYKFDGFDIDWEYPSGIYKRKYTTLCRILYEKFIAEATETGKPRLMLLAAVAAAKSKVESSYEPEQIAKYLDLINVMAYDFAGSWATTIGHSSPLYVVANPSWKDLSSDAAMMGWVMLGAPKNKLVVGIPFYGRTFKINGDLNTFKYGDPAAGGGSIGSYTGEEGFLSYYEICELLESRAFQRKWDSNMQVPWAFGLRKGSKEVVGYDDVESVVKKTDYIKTHGFAGAMIWDLSYDDFNNNFCKLGRYPLINAIKKRLEGTEVEVRTYPPGPVIPADDSGKETDKDEKGSDVSCKNSKNGDILADPAFCNKFFICASGEAVSMKCPLSLVFSVDKKMCDWDYNVDCKGRENVPFSMKPIGSKGNTALTTSITLILVAALSATC